MFNPYQIFNNQERFLGSVSPNDSVCRQKHLQYKYKLSAFVYLFP